jgi:hypothetical protein
MIIVGIRKKYAISVGIPSITESLPIRYAKSSPEVANVATINIPQ